MQLTSLRQENLDLVRDVRVRGDRIAALEEELRLAKDRGQHCGSASAFDKENTGVKARPPPKRPTPLRNKLQGRYDTVSPVRETLQKKKKTGLDRM